ncbi:GOLPH3/VPS74 family protein [Arthrobacter sp. P2b]|uniref:GOLPH3/VPS74 family protein n=1 Tax=Arthrobacter sp. P2b TaxID=1938741 RepID=UPI0009A689F0|nr:GPP34 family phosphoprotein [Arthrobacter sp. P2b]SLJ90776.1 Golgi phosphoprotein 3 (GPP34) [Arthrobacter sp. P2b]
MDAQSPRARELNLPQAFLLLATNDADGEPDVPQPFLQAGVAGAILAELDLLGAIELQGRHVRATGTAVESDFQQQLDLIRHKSRPHTPKRWVSMLESRAEVHRIYEGMAALGIVQHVGEKHLGLFRTTRYPEKDHAPEAALLQKISATMAAGSVEPAVADPRTNALIALLHAVGLLERLFPEADRGRARELTYSHWPSHAVVEELRSVRLAEAEAAT